MKGPSGNGPKSDRGVCSTSARDAAYVRKGLFLAALTGVIFSLDGPILKQGLVKEPFSIPEFWLLAPLFAAGCHDISAACLSLVLNVAQGKGREVFRTFCSKPGKFCIMGAFMGAPLGMGGYLMGISLAGPAYALPISTLYPAIAAVLARFFLKERISARAMCGLALCVAGAFTVGWSAPQGGVGGQAFYLGLGFAFLAAFGWASEGVCVTAGMDFIEPVVALNVYQIVSSLLYVLVIVPAAFVLLERTRPGLDAVGLLMQAFASPGLPFCIAAGLVGCISYRCWYTAMNITGVCRAMALNVTYALWGILFSALFTNVTVTRNLVAGAVVIVAGIVLVVMQGKSGTALRQAQEGR